MLRVRCTGLVSVALVALMLPLGLLTFATEPAEKGHEKDAKAKQKILNSDEWREAKLWFKEWLSEQRTYDKTETEELKARLEKRIAAMSSEELQEFLESMQAKLTVLMSPESKEARAWIGRFLSVQAIYSEEDLKKMRPDIEKMTAGQLQAHFEEIKRKRASLGQQSAAFSEIRKQQLKSIREGQIAAAKARAEARSRPAYSATQYSPYTPRQRPSFYAGYMRPPPTLHLGARYYIY